MPLSNLSTTSVKGDIYGGLTAAIVALPLALAFGVASGAGPIAGIYGAIFVGFFASLFGGTRTQISGPTGPMTVVMASILTASAASGVGYAFLVVILGGVLQIVFGVFKLGRYIRLMPFSVISGFMSGIGVIIILIQLNQIVGLPSVSSPVSALKDLGLIFTRVNLIALMMGLLSLVIVFFTPRRVNQLIPGALIALILCTLLATFLLPKDSLPVLGAIPTGFPSIVFPEFDINVLPQILGNAVILALLGSIDSLLTSLVADSATNTQHDSNKELIGQGIGNIVAGFFAGLPGAGATMRTIVNINAGGVSPLSGIIHALVLFIIIAGAGPLASHIPHTVLAAILIKVGYDIIDWQTLKRISTTPASDSVIMFTVMMLTVFVDLITAVAVGLIMACVLLTKKLSDIQLDQMDMISHIGDLDHLPRQEIEFIHTNLDGLFYCRLKGPLSFAAAKDMARTYHQQLSHEYVLLDLSEAIYLDHSTIRALEDIIERTRGLNIPISIYCDNKQITNMIRSQIHRNIHVASLLFNNRMDALAHLCD